MRKLLMVVNEDWFFLSHRKAVAVAALNEGWDVTIVAHDNGNGDTIRELGLKFIPLEIDSTGMNPFQELKTLRFLIKLYKANIDAIVHHVGLKNILWGSIAARIIKVKGVVNAVSGLGTLFSDEKSMFCKLLLCILKWGHKRKNLDVIFQNHDDEALFDKYSIVPSYCKRFIKGSGIDLNDFKYVPQPDGEMVRIIFTGRMIEEKGVLVLIEAANKLRPTFEGKIEFILVGNLHSNPKAITRERLESLCDNTYIKWLGYRTDVKNLLIQSNIVAFPSFYREGLPKSLIEANAVGRPIITTDSIGCRDAVEDGVNGFIIPIKDSSALADKLSVLINDSRMRDRMGKAARKIAERDFGIENVIKKHLDIYSELNCEQ